MQLISIYQGKLNIIHQRRRRTQRGEEALPLFSHHTLRKARWSSKHF
jgi:hypothetical protein